MMESFTVFSKRTENCTCAAEAVEALYTDTQTSENFFSVVWKTYFFIIECKDREENLLPTKYSLILDNNFNKMKGHKKDNKLNSKLTGYHISNNTNQGLIEAKN